MRTNVSRQQEHQIDLQNVPVRALFKYNEVNYNGSTTCEVSELRFVTDDNEQVTDTKVLQDALNEFIKAEHVYLNEFYK